MGAAALAIPVLYGMYKSNQQGESERALARTAQAPYESGRIQRFLPPQLRNAATGPILDTGLAGLADLIRNPGSLSPTVEDAIRPRLAMESQSIAQNFRNMQAQQTGALNRGNAPVSIKTALESALNISQERAQRAARQGALAESGALQREDIMRIFPLLDALLQFTSSGRGQAIQGLGAASQTEAARMAAQLQMLGSLASSGATAGMGMG